MIFLQFSFQLILLQALFFYIAQTFFFLFSSCHFVCFHGKVVNIIDFFLKRLYSRSLFSISVSFPFTTSTQLPIHIKLFNYRPIRILSLIIYTRNSFQSPPHLLTTQWTIYSITVLFTITTDTTCSRIPRGITFQLLQETWHYNGQWDTSCSQSATGEPCEDPAGAWDTHIMHTRGEQWSSLEANICGGEPESVSSGR